MSFLFRKLACVIACAIRVLFFCGANAAEAVDAKDPALVGEIIFASYSEACQDTVSALSSIGVGNSDDLFSEIFLSFALVPSVDFIDESRPISVSFLNPDLEGELPDRAVVIPISPYGGARALRATIEENYGKIEGTKVFFCSEPKEDAKEERLVYTVVGDIALMANNQKALKWIATKFRNKDLPKANIVVKASPISLTIDGKMGHSLIKQIVPNAKKASGMAKKLSLLGDLLGTLTSLDLSIRPGSREWRIDAKLNYPFGIVKEKIETVRPPREELMTIFPDKSYCRSLSALPLLISLLPRSFRDEYGGDSYFTNLSAFHIFPKITESEKRIYPYISGDRASAYVIQPLDGMLGKVEVYTIKNPQRVEELLSKVISPITNDLAFVVLTNDVRIVNNTKVYGYNIEEKKSSFQEKSEFSVSAINIIYNMNIVEVAVKDDLLFVALGKSGLIDKWLLPDAFVPGARKYNTILSPFEDVGDGVVSLGGGEVLPSQTLNEAVKVILGLEDFSRGLPFAGSGFYWRLSKCKTGLIYEISLSHNEILAFQTILNLDTSVLGQFVLNFAIEKSVDE